DVRALFFETPFFTSHKASKSALSMDLPFRVIDITRRHLEIVKRPKYGYGGNMNPCIDCHALMFRIAGEMLEEEDAGFVLTGEVLGQRPMSQNKRSLSLVASESGLDRLLLRPLSAKRLPVTIPEEKGWVRRELLTDFQGRSRKPQMALARRLDINEYPSPAGGCLLTEKVFSRRLKDLLSFQADPEPRELELLKLGRHFRIDSRTKVVVGRNKAENQAISALSADDDFTLTSVSVPGPTSLAMGSPSDALLEFAAGLTAAYGDVEGLASTEIRVTGRTSHTAVSVRIRDKKEFRPYMI
ncbi:MAG: tRNA 4-thiouridine(8) synthase ThiI, partial [Thermodesulfobacteriota bacterium]|nr:tRNA 4-thiouridine(8) synthase ThiI [Thermodesulfobacteriota bacterium]